MLCDLRDSLIAATCLLLGAWILSVPLLGNSYYLSVFLPLLAVACLSVAWFAYLSRDNFIPARQQRSTETPVAGKSPGTEFFAAWDAPIIARSDTIQSPVRRTLTRVLVLTACHLAIASTMLYHFLGIGARYFISG